MACSGTTTTDAPCSICLEPLATHTAQVACGHCYHSHCLLLHAQTCTRLHRDIQCPLCRAPLLEAPPFMAMPLVVLQSSADAVVPWGGGAPPMSEHSLMPTFVVIGVFGAILWYLM